MADDGGTTVAAASLVAGCDSPPLAVGIDIGTHSSRLDFFLNLGRQRRKSSNWSSFPPRLLGASKRSRTSEDVAKLEGSDSADMTAILLGRPSIELSLDGY